MIAVGVCGAGLEFALGGLEEDDVPALRSAFELGLLSLEVACDGGDLDLDPVRDPMAGRSGDSAFLPCREEFTRVTSLVGRPADLFQASCSGSISSTGRFAGDRGIDGNCPGVRLGLVEMLGGMEPNTDSGGGPEGVGD